MSLAELEKELLALPEQDRARLVVSLLETLPPPEMEISDEEVFRRDAELSSGQVQEISHEEFVRQAERDRSR
jgi:hypothetical protein